MPGILHLSKHDPDTPVDIHIGAVGRIKDIKTTARYAPALIADHRRRNDVHTLRVVAAGETTILDGPLADRYRRTA